MKVLYSRDHKGVGVAHEITSPKNQPQFTLTMMKQYCLGKTNSKLVMCDISKKYRFRNNFVDIVTVSIFDTALADFDIYRKGNILR